MATKPKANAASGGGSRVSKDRLFSEQVIPTDSGRALQNVPRRTPHVTFDENPIEHWISDMELNQLSELRKDHVVEIFWGTLGIFLGSIVPAMEKLPKLGNAQNPIGSQDLAVLLICCVSLLLTIIMGFFWFQRTNDANDLGAKIRSRKKFEVTNPNQQMS
ncbi:hypothetical protein IHQ71_26725 [Rhizobium sp. TH2]|uniref:hypothetical protein n=1 Tax=Rhizobium sp. TH2 TaxID=2775403 RepID=UPI0021589C2A|nr:hypothetical protein [Rhizobium sp. TH2]UVC08680.1 hypothetical protein IHQ71_26725 [Rhizobium sp. TH2]